MRGRGPPGARSRGRWARVPAPPAPQGRGGAGTARARRPSPGGGYLRPLTLAPHSRPPARLPQPDGEAPRGVRSSSSLPYLPPLPSLPPSSPSPPPPSFPALPPQLRARQDPAPPARGSPAASAAGGARRADPGPLRAGARLPAVALLLPGSRFGPRLSSRSLLSRQLSSRPFPSREPRSPLPSTAPPAPSPPLSCPALPAFPLSFLAAARLPTAARPGTLPRSPGRDRQVPGAARPPSAPPRPRGLGAGGAWGPGRPPPAHSGAAGGRAGCQPPGGLRRLMRGKRAACFVSRESGISAEKVPTRGQPQVKPFYNQRAEQAVSRLGRNKLGAGRREARAEAAATAGRTAGRAESFSVTRAPGSTSWAASGGSLAREPGRRRPERPVLPRQLCVREKPNLKDQVLGRPAFPISPRLCRNRCLAWAPANLVGGGCAGGQYWEVGDGIHSGCLSSDPILQQGGGMRR